MGQNPLNPGNPYFAALAQPGMRPPPIDPRLLRLGQPGQVSDTPVELSGAVPQLPGWLQSLQQTAAPDMGQTASNPLFGEGMFDLPKTKTELALSLAGMVAPGAGKLIGKGAKAALGAAKAARIGSTVAAGAPEAVEGASLLGKALEGFHTPVTAAEVYARAAKGSEGLPFSDYVKANPEGGMGMFGDLTQAQPGIPSSEQLLREVPPRGVPKRIAENITRPEVASRLTKWFKEGMAKMPESWYRAGPLLDKMQGELGPAGGEEAFQRFFDSVAATSPRATVQDNIRTASHYYHQWMQGKPFPEVIPPGYGSLVQKTHLGMANRFRAGTIDPLENPKPMSYGGNLKGNERNVAIDAHNFKAFGMASEDPRFLQPSVDRTIKGPDGKNLKDASGEDIVQTIKPRQMFKEGNLTMQEALADPSLWAEKPEGTEYGALEAFQQGLAKKLKVTPSTWQEKLWIGAGPKTGLGSLPEPFLRILQRRIEYTAHRLGKDPNLILKQFVRGEIPLLEMLGPLAGAGATAAAAGAIQPPDDGSRQ